MIDQLQRANFEKDVGAELLNKFSAFVQLVGMAHCRSSKSQP
jgi:hypothetical protein